MALFQIINATCQRTSLTKYGQCFANQITAKHSLDELLLWVLIFSGVSQFGQFWFGNQTELKPANECFQRCLENKIFHVMLV